VDFENAFIPVDTKQSHLLRYYLDIARILADIRFTMQLRYNNQQEFETYINEQSYNTQHSQLDIPRILTFIDNIRELHKETIQVLRYDQNVF